MFSNVSFTKGPQKNWIKPSEFLCAVITQTCTRCFFGKILGVLLLSVSPGKRKS